MRACSGATTYHTVLDVDRGLSWADAAAYRDNYIARRTAAGEEVDPNTGFWIDRLVPNHGKTGARALS